MARRLHPKRVGADAESSLDATVVAVAVAVASERFLTWNAYMAVDAFSLADISAYPIKVFLSDQIDWSAHPHLKRGSNWSGVGRACPPS
jgi:glutathione S-transferase